MNNILIIIKKELKRFFGDRRLVMTTLIMPGVTIFLVYSLMGNMMSREFTTADDYVTKAYALNLPAEIREMTAEMPIEWKDWDGNDAEAIKKEIEDGEMDLALVFQEDFSAAVAAYEVGNGDAPQIEIYYNSAKTDSETSYENMLVVFKEYERTICNKFDVNRSENGSLGSFDVAPKNGMAGRLLSGMLPLLIMTLIFSGVQSVAPESIAGEKERGTIATLLVTPTKRSAIAIGKVTSLTLISLLSGLSSFAGTIASLPKMLGGNVNFDLNLYTTTDYVLLLMLIASTVLVLVAAISIASVTANSVKEATTMMAPMMVVVMVVSLMPMLGINFGGKAAVMIPLFNSVSAMAKVFAFETDAGFAVIAVCVNVVASGILVVLLTQMFNSEKVMFSK
ncbi:MAG: ABC transporter permease [Lachnospiraceae bacterium]|nr:ABC transporter permease [Lachnospiraceae bacterium]